MNQNLKDLELHRLLKRQIKKTLGKKAVIDEKYQKLLQLINETYQHHEEDRMLLERSMDLSSQELSEANQYLKEQKQDLENAYKDLKATQNALETSQKIANLSKSLQEQKEELITANKSIITQNAILREHQKQIDEKNKLLLKSNRQIQASIRAAKMIQDSILPYQQKLDSLFKEYFIIYLPKDIVSGDFYWLNKVKNKIFLAAVDCTGHGVPGAFMSLIGNNLLDKIIRVWAYHNPAEILEKMHEDIQVMLHQEDSGNNNGMDLSLVSIEEINKEEVSISFSGAKNNLFYVSEEKPEIQELRGTRKSIGGIQGDNKVFEQKELILQKGSWIYLGSDGFEDQNDKKRKKLGTKKIRDTLQNIWNLTAKQQKEMLLDLLNTHMKNTDQRDDILFMGFQV